MGTVTRTWQILTISAVRYALGQSSGIVPITIKYIKQNIGLFDFDVLIALENDVHTWVKEEHAYTKGRYFDEWTALYATIKDRVLMLRGKRG